MCSTQNHDTCLKLALHFTQPMHAVIVICLRTLLYTKHYIITSSVTTLPSISMLVTTDEATSTLSNQRYGCNGCSYTIIVGNYTVQSMKLFFILVYSLMYLRMSSGCHGRAKKQVELIEMDRLHCLLCSILISSPLIVPPLLQYLLV